MKWVLSFVFVLMFGFCAVGQKDSTIQNLIPALENGGFFLKDTTDKKYIQYVDDREIITVITKNDYDIRQHTVIVYNEDSVKYFIKREFFIDDSINVFHNNMNEGDIIEFRDIFYFANNTPPIKKLNKKLIISNRKGIITNQILPDFSQNKVDNSGRRIGKWVTKIKSKNGNLLEEKVNYRNGKEISKSKLYLKNNFSKEIKFLNDSIRIEKTYYPNGKLLSILTYSNQDTFGPISIYYPNGKLKTLGNYTLQKDRIRKVNYIVSIWNPWTWADSNILYYKSVKDKTWEYFNTKGKLIRKEIYEQGKLIRKEDY